MRSHKVSVFVTALLHAEVQYIHIVDMLHVKLLYMCPHTTIYYYVYVCVPLRESEESLKRALREP
jgi:hypothetical protein